MKLSPLGNIHSTLFALLIISAFIIIGVRPQTPATFGLVNSTSTSPNNVHSVRYSPDGMTIAYTAQSSGLAILNAADLTSVASSSLDFGGSGFALALSYSRTNSSKLYYQLYSGSTTSTGPVSWPNNNLTLNPAIPSTITNVTDLDVSPDDSKLIVCGENGFEIIHLSNSNVARSNPAGYWGSLSCKFAADHGYAVVKNYIQIEVFDQSHNKIAGYSGSNWIYGIDWNSNGTLLAFVEFYKGLVVLDKAANTTTVYHPVSASSYLHAVDWSPNDQMIAYSIYNNKTVVINATSKALIYETPSLSGNVL